MSESTTTTPTPPDLSDAEAAVTRVRHMIPELLHLIAVLGRSRALGDFASWGVFTDADVERLCADVKTAADTLANWHNRAAEACYKNVPHLKHQPVPRA